MSLLQGKTLNPYQYTVPGILWGKSCALNVWYAMQPKFTEVGIIRYEKAKLYTRPPSLIVFMNQWLHLFKVHLCSLWG